MAENSNKIKLLKRNMVSFNTRKHSNEKLLYTVHTTTGGSSPCVPRE